MGSIASPIINKETLSDLKEWRADCKCVKDAFLAQVSRETDPLAKTLYRSLAASFVNAELISSWIELSLVAINDLGKAVGNTPNSQKPSSTEPSHEFARTGQKLSKTPKNNKKPSTGT